MQRLSFKCIVNYLDDFLIIGQSYEECLNAQLALINLLIKLGFAISWNKLKGPTQNIAFLELQLD